MESINSGQWSQSAPVRWGWEGGGVKHLPLPTRQWRRTAVETDGRSRPCHGRVTATAVTRPWASSPLQRRRSQRPRAAQDWRVACGPCKRTRLHGCAAGGPCTGVQPAVLVRVCRRRSLCGCADGGPCTGVQPAVLVRVCRRRSLYGCADGGPCAGVQTAVLARVCRRRSLCGCEDGGLCEGRWPATGPLQRKSKRPPPAAPCSAEPRAGRNGSPAEELLPAAAAPAAAAAAAAAAAPL